MAQPLPLEQKATTKPNSIFKPLPVDLSGLAGQIEALELALAALDARVVTLEP